MLSRHARQGRRRFHVPGHKGGLGPYRGLAGLVGERALSLDLTELPDLDDLHWPVPGGAFEEAQALAAEAFGSRQAWILAGGSTAGVLAMVLAAVGPGRTLLAPLPFHRSVAAAAILTGCDLRALPPRLEGPAGIPIPETAEVIGRAVAALRPAAILVTSPSYEGAVADLPGLAILSARAGVPLLVDAAHGGHLGFSPELPAGPMSSGASACVVSLHKTAGALTPGAVLLLGSSRPAAPSLAQPPPLDHARVGAALRLVQTSSPSFPVLASTDLARRRLALQGARDWSRAARLSDRTAAEVVRTSLGRLEAFVVPPGLGRDPTRLVFVLTGAAPPDLTGLDLADLAARGGLDLEMAGWGHIVAVATPADTARSHRRLVGALSAALSSASSTGPTARDGNALAAGVDAAPAASLGVTIGSGIGCAIGSAVGSAVGSSVESGIEGFQRTGLPGKRELALALEKDCWGNAPVYVMTPSEAFRRPHLLVPVAEAVGRVAADVVCPYPPGVPLVVPGQLIDEAVAGYLAFLGRSGHRTQGLETGAGPGDERGGIPRVEVVA